MTQPSHGNSSIQPINQLIIPPTIEEKNDLIRQLWDKKSQLEQNAKSRCQSLTKSEKNVRKLKSKVEDLKSKLYDEKAEHSETRFEKNLLEIKYEFEKTQHRLTQIENAFVQREKDTQKELNAITYSVSVAPKSFVGKVKRWICIALEVIPRIVLFIFALPFIGVGFSGYGLYKLGCAFIKLCRAAMNRFSPNYS